MDASRFDRLARILGSSASRRGVLAGLAGLLPARDVAGKGKHHKHRGKERRQRRDPKRLHAQQADCWPGIKCTAAKGANVSRCDLEESTAFNGLDCTRCNLSYTNLRGADARGATFTRANLSYACLVDADLSGAKIVKTTNTSFAIFCRTTMPGGSVNNSGCSNGTACCPTCRPLGATGCTNAACCGGSICESNTCVCPSGETNCSGACRNLQTDRNHCGSCGDACAQGEVCQGGVCGDVCGNGFCPAASANPDCCAGACTDTQTDLNNCGQCGNACADQQVCAGSTCCAPPGTVGCTVQNFETFCCQGANGAGCTFAPPSLVGTCFTP